jgi:hypothetical protein
METNTKQIIKDFQVISNSLNLLENEIEKHLNFKPSLTLILEDKYIKIHSDNLKDELGNTLVNSLFKNIRIEFTGSMMSSPENMYWFTSNLRYEHINSGTNGVNFLWYNIIFDMNTQTWIFTNLIK